MKLLGVSSMILISHLTKAKLKLAGVQLFLYKFSLHFKNYQNFAAFAAKAMG